MEVNNNSPVVQFYDDKTVFITGATGFMGKVLVEKLLRSTNILKLLLLIRPKRGVQTEQRLQTLLSSSVFDRVREIDPALLEKVEVVNGDITEDNLGIDEQAERVLTESVNVVFHCAATVRFDEDLTKSVAMNVSAVLAIIDLAKKMKNLEALVDVSTAYCNCDLKNIDEIIYPPPGNPRGLVDCCKWMDSEKLDGPEMTKIMIGNRPNTYTFTKALAETVLHTEGAGLPLAIIRPSIVTAAWKEPFPGWVDNFNGATGVLAGAGAGLMRTLYCKRSCVADMVPVDVCINLMCVLGWKAASQPASTTPVYNCTSGGINPITWGQVEAWGLQTLVDNPYQDVFWYPGGSYKENWYLNRFFQLLFHYGPAHCVDLLCRLSGRKPFLVKISNMMQKSTKALEPFTTNSWNWSNNNVVKLEGELTIEDRAVFGFDIKTDFDWKEYLAIYVQGIRKFLFKSDPSTIPSSRRYMNLLWWVDLLTKGLFITGALYLLGFLIL
eukprot:TRINITY_DN847_c0_g1_i3.p1 TRINITY_DN847_c0_g1~~TRINITY_DN847_c0_g1_i3.p1  ORF type:complete len:495 (-),score=113.85 TRINITY_DN847_c0_g1_i3:79-1563(-)